MDLPKLKPADTLIKIDPAAQTATAYNGEDRRLWQYPCLADGQHPDWQAVGGHTPPGFYKLGEQHLDYEVWIHDPGYPPYSKELASFGWCSFDMIDLTGNEDNSGRAGIMLHGGGSAEGWPGAWAPFQPLHPTYGCLRMHNAHLQDHVRPLLQVGTVYVMVDRG